MLSWKAATSARGVVMRKNEESHVVDQKCSLLFFGLWIALLIAGYYGLTEYTYKPTDPKRLVEERTYEKGDCWRLVIAVHPQCPCTHATVSELERLLGQHGNSMECIAYVFCPGSDFSFAETLLVERIRRMPFTKIEHDIDGTQASKYFLDTSGECILFDESGQPCFRGGLTYSRGHEGYNAGSQSIAMLVSGERTSLIETPVYGCSIR